MFFLVERQSNNKNQTTPVGAFSSRQCTHYVATDVKMLRFCAVTQLKCNLVKIGRYATTHPESVHGRGQNQHAA